jgi:putative hydrolase of the HAD superfamily
MPSSAIRAVFFDAVGTLLHPQPPAAEVYASVGRRWGSGLSQEVVASRFRSAFAREDERDRAAGWHTSEAREVARWRRIVTAVLDDVEDVESCFRELWEHFGRPESWDCDPVVESVLGLLAGRGLAVGIASNFDGRLRRVLAGTTPLRSVWRLVISSEVGWRKPSPSFFAGLRKVTGLAGGEILMVGDDRVNDFDGAKAAGLRALWLDGREVRLADVPHLLERPS